MYFENFVETNFMIQIYILIKHIIDKHKESLLNEVQIGKTILKEA